MSWLSVTCGLDETNNFVSLSSFGGSSGFSCFVSVFVSCCCSFGASVFGSAAGFGSSASLTGELPS